MVASSPPENVDIPHLTLSLSLWQKIRGLRQTQPQIQVIEGRNDDDHSITRPHPKIFALLFEAG